MHAPSTSSLDARATSQAALQLHHSAGDLVADRGLAPLVVNWCGTAGGFGGGCDGCGGRGRCSGGARGACRTAPKTGHQTWAGGSGAGSTSGSGGATHVEGWFGGLVWEFEVGC